MSTRYYAVWSIPFGSSKVSFNLFIGYSSRGFAGLGEMSGQHFPTIEAWTTFLRHNHWCIDIVDEHGYEYDTEKFIELMITHNYPTHPSESLIKELTSHYTISPYDPNQSTDTQYWLDGQQLFSKD